MEIGMVFSFSLKNARSAFPLRLQQERREMLWRVLHYMLLSNQTRLHYK
jgi:hypothetical protein